MVSRELLGYIKASRTAGFSDESIRDRLAQSGYPHDVVEGAFQEVSTPGAAPNHPPLYSVEEEPGHGVTPGPPHADSEDEAHQKKTPEISLNSASQPSLQEQSDDSTGLSSGLFSRLGQVLVHPGTFFIQLRGEEKPFRALSQYLFVGGVCAVMWFLVLVCLGTFAPDIFFTVFGTLEIEETSIALLMTGVISILMMLAVVLVWHLFVLILHGTGGLSRSLQVYIYSILPLYLFSWIPLLNILLILYLPVQLVQGLKKLHTLSTFKALVLALLLLISLAITSVLVMQGVGMFMMFVVY